ncbi:hypothetical protein BLOT_007450 [Blomia tropicalis]|nr:hypothetical protein BLOT_007450 [Blomia tropicalis]
MFNCEPVAVLINEISFSRKKFTSALGSSDNPLLCKNGSTTQIVRCVTINSNEFIYINFSGYMAIKWFCKYRYSTSFSLRNVVLETILVL